METLHFSIVVHAPKERVWDVMLGEDSYKQWTEAFMPGSHYIGDWSEGSKILFVAPNKNGKLSGMVSRIQENRPYEYISIEHAGFVEDGEENTESEAVGGWKGAHENYTFRENGGVTEVLVEADSDDENKKAFEDSWPKALQKLKEMVEGE